MSPDAFSNEKKPLKKVSPITFWGTYKDYKVWHNPPHGYAVMKEDFRIHKQKFSTPKEAQVFIDKLPPPPSYKETLMRITGYPFGR